MCYFGLIAWWRWCNNGGSFYGCRHFYVGWLRGWNELFLTCLTIRINCEHLESQIGAFPSSRLLWEDIPRYGFGQHQQETTTILTYAFRVRRRQEVQWTWRSFFVLLRHFVTAFAGFDGVFISLSISFWPLFSWQSIVFCCCWEVSNDEGAIKYVL